MRLDRQSGLVQYAMAYRDPEKRKATQRAWAANNAERRQAYQRAYYAAHREKKIAYARANYDPERNRAYNEKWRRENPERQKWHARKTKLRKYGITLEQYESMFVAQGGRCAICAEPHPKLNVDHDHRTGVVRALLCGPCNRGIGLFRDKADRLRLAADYLERMSTKDRAA